MTWIHVLQYPLLQGDRIQNWPLRLLLISNLNIFLNHVWPGAVKRSMGRIRDVQLILVTNTQGALATCQTSFLVLMLMLCYV